MIKIENISKKFESFMIKNIHLEINKGEYFVILGPSGSGKTLILEMIAGLTKPDSGRISGVDHSRIGLIYQDYMLFPHMNVYQNIAYGLNIRKEKKETVETAVQSVAQQLGIHSLLNRDVKSISGGEKQRVAIARALVMDPELFLFDEPTAALDLSTKIQTQRWFLNLHKKQHTTIIHVTHDFEEALALGDRIALLFEGEIVQTDKPEHVFNHPVSKAAADFLGYKNVFSGKIEDNLMPINGIEIMTPQNKAGHAFIAVRSNDIILSKKTIVSSARNSFKGKVIKTINRTNHVEIVIDIGVIMHVDITYQSFREIGLEMDDQIWATFKTSAVKVFEH